MFARHESPPPRPALLPAAAGEVQILPNPSSLMSFSPSRDRAKFDAVPPSRCCSEVHERQNGPTIDESIIGPEEAMGRLTLIVDKSTQGDRLGLSQPIQSPSSTLSNPAKPPVI